MHRRTVAGPWGLDIRLFWLTDKRFLSQFESCVEGVEIGKEVPVFHPLSKFPSCYKDVSFFLPEGMDSECKI